MSGATGARDKGSRAANSAVIFRDAPLWRVLALLCEHGYTFDEIRRMTMQELNEVYDSLPVAGAARRAGAGSESVLDL